MYEEYIEFHEMTRQGGKLGVLWIVISDAKFLNRLSNGRHEASNSWTILIQSWTILLI